MIRHSAGVELVQVGHSGSRAKRVTLARASGSEPSLDGISILVVEDHADSRELLRQFFRSRGAELLLAGDGTEALEALRARIPDIVLTDIRMPRMDGMQLARRMKRDLRWARVPLVAVTAYNTPTDLRKTLEVGFDGHVEKPINFDGLLATVSRLVARRRTRRPSPRRPR
jgi:CheY-like chemotaxis protein